MKLSSNIFVRIPTILPIITFLKLFPVPRAHPTTTLYAAWLCSRYCEIGADSNPALPKRGGLPIPPPSQPPPLSYQDFVQLTDYITDEPPAFVEKSDTSQAWVACTRSTVPSFEECTPPTADDSVGVGRSLSDSDSSGQVERSDGDIVVKARFRRKKWKLFVGGQIISAAVVVSEISLTVAFFYNFFKEADNATIRVDSECYDGASTLYFAMMFTLVFGLFTEVASAVGLSFIYRSPLDIKSAHKIPHDDAQSVVASMVVNVLAPLSWGVIHMCGGIVGFILTTPSSCLGHEKSGLETYLYFSSLYMVFVGFKMLGVSVFMVFFSCGSPAKCTDSCCVAVKTLYSHRILSIAAFLDLFWQLQCAVWLHRMGAVGLAYLLILLMCGVAGGVFAVFGSQAPDVVDELPGPLPPAVVSRPPDDYEKP